MNPDTALQSFDKGLKNEFDDYFTQAIGNTKVDPKDILGGAIDYVDCNKKHFEGTSLDQVCKISY